MKMNLGVSAELIETHGVISSQVAGDMARAARHSLDADWGVGITGVAGATEVEGHPPGTMHIAVHDGRAPRPSPTPSTWAAPPTSAARQPPRSFCCDARC